MTFSDRLRNARPPRESDRYYYHEHYYKHQFNQLFPSSEMTELNQDNTESTPRESHSAPTILSPRKRLKAHIEELEAKLAGLTQELESEKDKRLRLAAEYDNYRRRTNSEYRQMVQNAGERIILKLLPVVDDIDRLLSHHEGERASRPLNSGTEETMVSPEMKALDLIYKKLQSTLTAEGLAPIESVGKPFDATLHDAITQVSVSGAVEGTIYAEIEKGYKLADKIVRHAKVVICAAPEPAATDAALLEQSNG
jgi:molecular chaperone GrpE